MALAAATKLIGKRYGVLDIIGSGGMGTVYKAQDRLHGKTVALKQVTLASERLDFGSQSDTTDFRTRLAQEFGILASLRHPNIISVLDYGFDEDKQPYYTMDLLEDSSTIIDYGGSQILKIKISLLTQLLRALAYLHRRGIIHRDLKPANVLVYDDQIKVLDFGLSITQDQHEQSGSTSGTLAYLAPEVLSGEPVTASTDLYAVGVIMYQLLVGKHPFDLMNLSRLVEAIMTQSPDLSEFSFNRQLGSVAGRLMAKTPDERFHTAEEVLLALGEAVGSLIPIETTATRESFLQAAKLIGRDAELTQLNTQLAQAMGGKGSTWLLAGESGVGKSRLIDEIRIRGLVGGAHVLHGQGVAEGGTLYQIWREPLRWLALNTELTSLEASVLKALVPDIGILTAQDVPDPIEFEPRTMQDRLLSVIEGIFRRQTEPILLLLEDLHWANEGLEVLARLSRVAPTLPLLILGSYRDDESVNIERALPDASVLHLQRLSADSITQLSESMLGEIGRQPHLVQMLQRETEGNVFFLIEVVRTLAESSGQLDRVGTATLPSNVLAGGIKNVVQRRLAHVDARYRPLLELAAVYGRQIDLDFLHSVAGNIDPLEWLTACSDAHVLSPSGERWLFAHDKLREGLLNELPVQRLRELHEHVAKTIEAISPDSSLQAASLAHHWNMAQNVEKELHYLQIAGEAAFRTGVTQEVLDLYGRARLLSEQLNGNSKDPKTLLTRAHIDFALGSIYQRLGEFDKAEYHLEFALTLLGEPIPKHNALLATAALRELFLQGIRRPLPGLFGRRTRNVAELTEITRILTSLSEVHVFRHKFGPIIYGGFRRLNLAETIGESPELARAYGTFSLLMAFIPWQAAAQDFERRSLKIVEALNEPSLSIETALYIASYRMGCAKFTEALDVANRAIQLCTQLGNSYYLGLHYSTLAWVNYYYFADYAKVEELHRNLYALAIENNYIQLQIWGLSWTAESQRFTIDPKQLAATGRKIEELRKLVLTNPDQPQEVRIETIAAFVALRQKRYAEALAIVKQTLTLLAAIPPTFYTLASSYSDLNKVILTLLEMDNASVDRNEVLKTAKRARTEMKRFARVFPIGQPIDLLWNGVYEGLTGKPEEALHSLQKARSLAEKLGMKFETAQTYYYEGKFLPQDNTSRRKDCLTQAAQLFKQLGAHYDLQLAQTAM